MYAVYSRFMTIIELNQIKEEISRIQAMDFIHPRQFAHIWTVVCVVCDLPKKLFWNVVNQITFFWTMLNTGRLFAYEKRRFDR